MLHGPAPLARRTTCPRDRAALQRSSRTAMTVTDLVPRERVRQTTPPGGATTLRTVIGVSGIGATTSTAGFTLR
eukprot:1568759-Pyramimonas_sp.AAC.1